MALETTTAEQEAHDQAHVAGSETQTSLVICLGSAYTDAPPEQISQVLPVLRSAFGAGQQGSLLVGYPVTRGDVPAEEHDGFLLQPFVESASSSSLIVQTAASWLNAYELMRAHRAQCCLLLGAEAQGMHPASVREMMDLVCRQGVDLAVPRYDLPSNQGLLNTAVLSPVSRAIFNVDVQYPLALDFAISARMAERMAAAAQRFTTGGQGDAVLWPVGEAAVAGLTFAEVATGPRELPHVTDDLGSILGRVAGSLFLDIEAKAAFWQRTRPASSVMRADESPVAEAAEHAPSPSEVAGLIETFRIGYGNLHDLWSLVLPPNTLVALKRLSVAPAENFRLPDAVWVRIVYDFVLAHRLRTIARNHLMGAFVPLYLAWVASHLVQQNTAAHAEQLARAFEADKPYLVSRWRWPDRFNP